ncbi:MAG: hypothetical protein RIS26_396 [Actinomycetota bacterium]
MQTSIIVAKLKNQATNAVFQMIRDWTVSGLIRESLWLDIDDPNTVLRVRGGEVTSVVASSWATTISDTPKFFAMQVLKDPKSALSLEEVTQSLDNVGAFRGSIPSLVNVVFPVSDSDSHPASYFATKLNLVALAFDAANPDSNGEPIDSKSRVYFANCAKELSTIVGLWPGQTSSVLDGIEFLPGSSANVVVERTFVRYVDASEFVKSVISNVIDGDGKSVPAPIEADNRHLNTISGPTAMATAQEVAKTFATNHPEITYKKFDRKFGDGPTAGNFLKVLQYYFQWVWNWIRRQPKAILQQKVESLKASAAKRLQGMIGTNSRIMVEVGGRTAHDNPNGMAPMANEVIMETFANQNSNLLVAPEIIRPQDLWKNFAEAATALLDGSKPDKYGDILPVEEDRITRRVFTDPYLVSPNFRKNQFSIPANLNVPCKGHRLSPNDPLTARLVQKGIDETLRGGVGATTNLAEVSRLSQQLEQWRQSNTSFTWAVGDIIAAGISNALDDWEALGHRAQQVDDSELVKAELKAQKALTRLFLITFGLIGAALLIWLGQALWIFNTSHVWPPIAPWWAKPVGWVTLAVVLWNALGISMVWGAVNKFFKLEHELQSDEVAAHESEKTHIFKQITNLTQYYRQYQAWVSIISCFVHANDKEQRGASGELSLGKSAPQSITVATLLPNPSGTGQDLTREIASKYYRVGWLTSLMQDVLAKSIAEYNVITADNFANANDPLGRAQAWASGPDVSGAVQAHAIMQIQQLSTQGTAYRDWRVKRINAIGEEQIETGAEVIGQLASGSEFMPSNTTFTAQASVGKAAKLNETHSVCAFDNRLGLKSEFAREIKVEPNNAANRELDFLGLRFEATSLLNPTDVKVFAEAKSEPTPVADSLSPVRPGSQA